MKKSIYSPVKEQLQVLVEYINILESKKKRDEKQEIISLQQMIDLFRRQCEVYLNYEFLKQGKKHGGSSSL